jgi:SecD/SecF fusion protein
VKPILESRVEIGATLGAQSVFLGEISMAIGGAIVLLFILWFYRLAGLVAFGAIVLNVFMLLAVMRFLDATLTLPGIAGLVLTIGMAVDANILIYERIREELERGKELLQAARTGFERAMVTILDANVTTFLAGLVLYNVGVGPVRGFAVTLMVGIATTLFTAFFVSRLMFHYLLENKVLKSFDVHSMRLPQIDFVSRARVAITGSVVVIGIGLVHMFGFVSSDTTFGLDFTGGANLRIVLKEETKTQDVREALEANEEFASQFPRAVVNSVGEVDAEGKADEFSIKVKLTDALREQIEREQREARRAGEDYTPPYVSSLRKAIGDKLVAPAFSDPQVSTNIDSDVSDFASIELHFDHPVPLETVRQRLSTTVSAGGAGVVVRVPGAAEAPVAASDLIVEWDVQKGAEPDSLFPMLADALVGIEGADGKVAKLSNPIPESQVIQGQIVDELRNYAIAALIIAMFLIVMFVRIRFHEFSYGYAAVVALIHDVLVTLVVVVAANAWGLVTAEIDLPMIAAFMTIIGYSINDTIVIFDRVRENLTESTRLGERISYGEILNRSINQTLSRTILTSATTLFVVLSQFLVNYGSGTGALEGFSFALVIGLISGTYSTMFVATPIVLWLRNRSSAEASGAAPAAKPSPAA